MDRLLLVLLLLMAPGIGSLPVKDPQSVMLNMAQGCKSLEEVIAEQPGSSLVHQSKGVKAALALLWGNLCNSSSDAMELLKVPTCLQVNEKKIAECFKATTGHAVKEARALKQTQEWSKVVCGVTKQLRSCTRAFCGQPSDFLVDLVKLTSTLALQGSGMAAKYGSECLDHA